MAQTKKMVASDGSKAIGVTCCGRMFETAKEADTHEQKHTKPGIIVKSIDTATNFVWLSDGWNDCIRRNTPKAKALMAKAKTAIEKGQNVKEVISLLTKAGFAITRLY